MLACRNNGFFVGVMYLEQVLVVGSSASDWLSLGVRCRMLGKRVPFQCGDRLLSRT